jgi:hypothetical protein
MGDYGLDSSSSVQGAAAGSCEHRPEALGSILVSLEGLCSTELVTVYLAKM